MIRPSVRFASAAALIASSFRYPGRCPAALPPAARCQRQAPAAPGQPPLPRPRLPATPVFPKPDPANFTAASPTKEVVNAFLQANWGFDENRVWQVQAILKTQVEGMSKVVVLIGDKTGKEKPASVLLSLYFPTASTSLPATSIIPFGEHPFAEYPPAMQQGADGPYRGSASKDLELVEFADFQCPHCKEAQANMDKLASIFPRRASSFRTFRSRASIPRPCSAAVRRLRNQAGRQHRLLLSSPRRCLMVRKAWPRPTAPALTLNSAVTKAGLDPTKVAACAATPEIKANVDASVKLGTDAGINSVPTLVINGHEVPVGQIPYRDKSGEEDRRIPGQARRRFRRVTGS